MAVGVEAAHGRPLPKNRASDSAPLGGNGPQYEGTVALDEYPFGKRLINNIISMVFNYNKQSILTPLENGQPHIFEELKRTMQDQIKEGHQIKIINKIEGFPVEGELLLRSIQEVDTWFKGYGF